MEVLIIGLGSIAKKHIAAIKAVDNTAVFYALRSAGKEAFEGVTNIYSLKELVRSPDFIIISNPTNLHSEAICSVIDLGVPLFIEKPPMHDIKESDAVIDKLMAGKIETYIACNLRFHPCIKYLKSFFTTSNLAVNEVNIYCGSYLPDWRPNTNYKDVYSARGEMGGGVHLDLFHELDYARWIFGLPENSRSYISSKSSLQITAADYANLLFEYETFNISIILNYYRRLPKRKMEILFADETWEVDILNATIKSDVKGLIFEDSTYNIVNTYKEQVQYFFQNVLAMKGSMNTFADSIQTLKLVLNE